MQISDAVVCINLDWQITFANPEAVKILQIESHHIESGSIFERLPQFMEPEVERHCRSVMQTGVPSHLEHFSSDRDLWSRHSILCHLRWHRNSRPRHYRPQRSTAPSGIRLRQLLQVLEATSDAVVSVNREGNFTFLNRCARKLLATKGDLLGKSIWKEFPFARHGRYRDHFTRHARRRRGRL